MLARRPKAFYIEDCATIANLLAELRSGSLDPDRPPDSVDEVRRDQLNALLLLVVSPDLGQQLLLGRLAGLEPAVIVSDVPAAEDEHRDTSRPPRYAAEKKPSFLKGEDYLAPPPILVHMQARWDPDDCRRSAPARRAWAARLLPLLALAGNEAVLDLGPGDDHPGSAQSQA